jgi:exoribonuclease-2
LKDIPGLSEQILQHDKIAQAIKQNRIDHGALQFASLESKAIIEDGVPIDIKPIKPNRATEIIENFMIISNAGQAQFLKLKKIPRISRVVKKPKRWDRIVVLANAIGEKLPQEPDAVALQEFLARQLLSNQLTFPDLSLAIIKLIGRGEYIVELPGSAPEGHFDLALTEYAHTTAPNRRFPDLIMQRLLKSVFTNSKVPYSNDELIVLAQRCTEKEAAATKVERRVRKSAAAIVLASQIGTQYDAIVTGVGEKGTWVRIISNQIEGKLAQGFIGVDVGDFVKVKLIHVDIRRGFIDFSRV